MYAKASSVIALSFALLGTGCRESPTDSTESPEEHSPIVRDGDGETADEETAGFEYALTDSTPTAILYFGGFGSCGFDSKGTINPLDMRSTALAFGMARWVVALNGTGTVAQRQHKTLVTCYPFWTNAPNDIKTLMNTLSGGGSGKSFLIENGLPTTPANNVIYWVDDLPGRESNVNKMTLGSFLDGLPRRLERNRVKKVAIIGHSYGGYTAIAAASRIIEANNGVAVTSVVTLDPISMKACTPDIFVQGVVDSTKPNAIPGGKPGCVNAPGTSQLSDSIVTTSRVRQLGRKKIWRNYFQTRDKYLHSSSYGRPDDVPEKEVTIVRNNPDGIANHIGYVFPEDTRARVWTNAVNEIKSAILNSLK